MNNRKSDSNLTKRVVVKTVGSVASLVPGLAQAWALAEALYGNALEIRQQKALEFIEAIRDDKKTFTKEILATEAFQDGFVLGLENYIRIRSKDKRVIAQAIFCGFAKTEVKEDFQLERFNDTLQKISGMGIWLLSFIHEVIEPLKREMIIKEVEALDLSKSDKPVQWWIDDKIKVEPFSKYLDLWFHEQYSPNSEKLKDKYGVNGAVPKDKLAELFDTERFERQKYYGPIAELEFLGLVRHSMQPAGWGSDSSVYRLTGYADKFIKYINPNLASV